MPHMALPHIALPHIPTITPTTVLDILAVAYLIYQFISIARGRRAAHILSGLWILVVVYLVAGWAHLELLRSLLAALAPYSAIAVIVIFPYEIRHWLSRMGRGR